MDSSRLARISVACVVIIAGTGATAAPKAKKPAPKPKAPAKRVVLGTKQLSGDQAVLGVTYTLGKEWPKNITLNSVEYSADRLRLGEESRVPNADEKFLILHLTIQNPLSFEQTIRYDSISLTAVDSTNTNREGETFLGAEATQNNLDISLKPGQKVNAYAYVVVPAKGIIPKLIIKCSEDLVLRYDLRGKVKPLTGVALDPEAKDGATALAEVPATYGKLYQVGNFDVTLTTPEYSTKPLPDRTLEEGERYLITTATVKNAHPAEQLLRYDTFVIKYTDVDGIDVSADQGVLAASRNVDFDANLPTGKEIKVRFVVKVAKDQSVARIVLAANDEARKYTFDASGVK